MNTNLKTTHHAIDFTLQDGTNGDFFDKTIDPGTIVGAVVEMFTDLPTDAINLSIKAGGSLVEDATCLQNWKQRNGSSYEDSFKSLHIEGNQTIKAIFYTDTVLAAPIKGQLILLLKTPC